MAGTSPGGEKIKPTKRPKTSACVQCMKAKIKCDGRLPCGRCLRYGIQCEPQLRGRGRPSREAAQIQAARAAQPGVADQLEQALLQVTPLASAPAASVYTVFSIMLQTSPVLIPRRGPLTTLLSRIKPTAANPTALTQAAGQALAQWQAAHQIEGGTGAVLEAYQRWLPAELDCAQEKRDPCSTRLWVMGDSRLVTNKVWDDTFLAVTEMSLLMVAGQGEKMKTPMALSVLSPHELSKVFPRIIQALLRSRAVNGQHVEYESSLSMIALCVNRHQKLVLNLIRWEMRMMCSGAILVIRMTTTPLPESEYLNSGTLQTASQLGAARLQDRMKSKPEPGQPPSWPLQSLGRYEPAPQKKRKAAALADPFIPSVPVPSEPVVAVPEPVNDVTELVNELSDADMNVLVELFS